VKPCNYKKKKTVAAGTAVADKAVITGKIPVRRLKLGDFGF